MMYMEKYMVRECLDQDPACFVGCASSSVNVFVVNHAYSESGVIYLLAAVGGFRFPSKLLSHVDLASLSRECRRLCISWPDTASVAQYIPNGHLQMER